jgi:outer membrane lipoprotein SlyB
MSKILFLLLLAGCANRIIIDPKTSTTPGNIYLDQMECERISEEVNVPTEMAKSAAIQGAASALLSAWIASKTGMPVHNAAGAGLASGAIVGSGSGAWSAYQRRQAIVKTCLNGRGYKVLE